MCDRMGVMPSRGKGHVMLALARIQFREEPAVGQHGPQGIAGLELCIGPGAEAAFRHPLDRHPQLLSTPA